MSVAANTTPGNDRTGGTWRDRWRRLPRDARDTLFLLGVIAWTVLPHAGHLPVWATVLALVVLGWRARLAVTGGALPGRWTRIAVLAVAVALTLWSFRTLFGKEAGVTLAVALMALKTLELRARRDAFVVFFLGFFIILTHFLYSQSLFVALAMLVSVWGLLTAVVLAHMPVGQPSLKSAAGLALRTAALGAPVMVLLFVLFPRIGPLWGVPQDGLSKTGLSNVLRLGSVAEVASDDTIALRLRFEGPPPSPDRQYFRGPVLSQFDGIEWRPAGIPYAYPGGRPRDPSIETGGEPVKYEMTLEPQPVASLPLLEATANVAPEGFEVQRRDDLQWLLPRPTAERLRLRGEAWTTFRYGLPRRSYDPAALDLPPGYNPRIIAWARALREEQPGDARAFAGRLMQQIRTGGYSYTLAPDVYGRDAIDEFWLDRKEGFCEHFATAFVVAMRAARIPARVVTGFQGMDPLPVDGWWVVRRSAAHAWAEYWQDGIGWIRADPTAAIAPDRINRSVRLAPQPGVVAGALNAMNPALLGRLRDLWESVNNRWNQWVLNYSRGQQFDLMRQLGIESPSWEDLAKLLVGSISVAALLGAAWAWMDRRRVDPWVRQMQRLRKTLAAHGVESAAHEPPRKLAARVRQQLGPAGEPVADLLDELERQRYARGARTRPDPTLTARFAQAARRLPAGAVTRMSRVARGAG